jgi:putative membrane protein
MMGYGWGMGGGGWIAMTIFWVALIVLVAWLVRRTLRDSSDRGPGFRGDDSGRRETPEQTLDRRFAAGEIDEATYRKMRGTLRSSRSSGPTEG